MTETEWLACDDPEVMLHACDTQNHDRKLRLFGCACCLRVWHLIPDEGSKNKVIASEQFADGILSFDQFKAVCDEAMNEAAADVDYDEHLANITSHISEISLKAAAPAAISAAWSTLSDLSSIPSVASLWSSRSVAVSKSKTSAVASAGFRDHTSWDEKMSGLEAADPGCRSFRLQELRQHSMLIRDIFGNPFRPATLDPRWLTSTVIDLARTIYEERVWERMPILADALMDAGCDSDEIINHCRGPGPHVRGCWVVDLLTGRE
jgi:hypothetical protein